MVSLDIIAAAQALAIGVFFVARRPQAWEVTGRAHKRALCFAARIERLCEPRRPISSRSSSCLREPELAPRYNIAPMQQVLVFGRAGKAREFAFRRWGLVPSWFKDAKSERSLINGRTSAK
jgi:hypothetical protein